jgi:hypothetical protein
MHYIELLLLLKPFHELETNLEKLDTFLRDAYLSEKVILKILSKIMYKILNMMTNGIIYNQN